MNDLFALAQQNHLDSAMDLVVDGTMAKETRIEVGAELPVDSRQHVQIELCRYAGRVQWNTMRHSFTHYDLDIRPIAVRVSNRQSMVQDTQDRVWYEIGASPPGGIAAPVNTLIQTLRNL